MSTASLGKKDVNGLPLLPRVFVGCLLSHIVILLKVDANYVYEIYIK